MPASTWRTAAGVVGAVVIGGAALVAAATTDSSTDPTASAASSPTASASPTATTSTQPALPTATVSPDATPENGSISAERAAQIAMSHLATVGDLVVEEIQLKLEDGRMIWDVEFVGDHEVELDAVTGAMLKLEIGNGGRTEEVGGDDHGDDHGGDDSGHHASNRGSS